MSKSVLAAAGVAVLAFGAGMAVQPAATPAAKPYRSGSVWDVTFVRVKPGMDAVYLSYLAKEWKAEHEALKKEGLILSYKVLSTEAHSTTDWNLMLMTEYKDLATMEANESKEEAVVAKIVGDDQKQVQGYKDRAEIREVSGGRLAREIVLEPRK